MTEEQKARIMEIAGITDMGQLSDGYHTFDSLYNQRLNLFAALVNTYRDRSWKTWNHEDGTPCFGGGWFLVCIDTPEGPYSYHYEAKDWDMFDCKELERRSHSMAIPIRTWAVFCHLHPGRNPTRWN